MMKKFLNIIFLYVVFCLVGAGLEWGYGAFWNLVGSTPWIYPHSPIHYTSLGGLPLWGFGGFIIVAIYKSVTQRRVKPLVGVVAPLLLAMLWIVIYTNL